MIPASISDYLERNHARYSLLSHGAAYTAKQEAAAAHVPAHEWAKTVVCFADGQPIMAVLPALFNVDLNRLQRAADAHSIRLANEREFASLYRDCEPGAMPPLGPLYHQRVFVDKSLASDPEVFFSAGTHHEAIRMPFTELERIVHPDTVDIAVDPSVPLAEPLLFIDPICGASIQEDVALWRSDYRGEKYLFCSQRCKMEFDDNPYAYATKG